MTRYKDLVHNQFRFMLIPLSGDVRIVTQDGRRGKNVVTGNVSIRKDLNAPFNNYNALSFGCVVVLREKVRT